MDMTSLHDYLPLNAGSVVLENDSKWINPESNAAEVYSKSIKPGRILWTAPLVVLACLLRGVVAE